jgi:hypothetical protein
VRHAMHQTSPSMLAGRDNFEQLGASQCESILRGRRRREPRERGGGMWRMWRITWCVQASTTDSLYLCGFALDRHSLTFVSWLQSLSVMVEEPLTRRNPSDTGAMHAVRSLMRVLLLAALRAPCSPPHLDPQLPLCATTPTTNRSRKATWGGQDREPQSERAAQLPRAAAVRRARGCGWDLMLASVVKV